jgi:hypothetical protein
MLEGIFVIPTLKKSFKIFLAVLAIIGCVVGLFLAWFGDILLALPSFNDLLWTDLYSYGVQLGVIICIGYLFGFSARWVKDNPTRAERYLIIGFWVILLLGLAAFRIWAFVVLGI